MRELAAALVEIAVRRRGPESLPDSNFLVYLLLGVYLLTALLRVAMISGLTAMNLSWIAVSTVIWFAFVFAVLTFFRLERRYRQTMSALLGAEVVIGLVFMPVGLIGLGMGFALAELPFLWLGIGFALWSVFIGGSLLARALSQPLIVGLMFEALLDLVLLSVGELFAPSVDGLSLDAA